MNTSAKAAATPADYKLDDQIGFLLRLASQRHSVIFQSTISEHLTPTQFATLMRVAELGEVSQNHLGRLAAMDIATTKGVVDRLKQKQLLATRPDPNDKRRSIISLTETGQRMIPALQLDGKEISSNTLAELKPTEQKKLLELLKKIC